ERHYGQTNVLVGIEHETKKRTKLKKEAVARNADVSLSIDSLATKEIVPVGAVDMTPVDDGMDDD
ncbi:MAG: hypothetical protein ACO3RQ_09390, partial [Litorivicinaceae bacterium]